MENNTTYRIRTKLGEENPINIPVNLMQEYNSFEILSLKVNTDETYRSYTSTQGIVIGRVSTANNGLGIPNVRVSIFVPKGQYEQSDEEAVLYPFSSPTDMDGDRVRYNLLPSDSDVDCYQVIGTLPTKRKILDNETVCEVFDKFYKYTTVTNEAGDFMLSNIPVGKQRLHIDADLSDIGPFLSQKPYDMIENLGFEKNKFESTRQFKTSSDLDSLAQVISQNKSVYVYPYWGDATENSSEMKITRSDLSLNYEFKTSAVFMGSVITDKQSNSIRQNCTANENAGKMADMVTGPGRIEMIRKTVDDKIEQYRIKGDQLINDNGVWCYMVPMNLDYVRTDEFGNIIPTDDPNKGVPTRARVRFRVTLNQMDNDNDTHKRASYLVPNNPKIDDEEFLKNDSADYSFGSDTWDESFVDLFWNKVYTVKNYIPRMQKTTRPTNRKHTGIKMVNHYGDNNPFPYNGLSIKLSFQYRLICVIVKIFIDLVGFLNNIISTIGALPCTIANIKILRWRPFKGLLKFIPGCIGLSPEFCDNGIDKDATYPGCGKPFSCVWSKKTLPECSKEQKKIADEGDEPAVCTNSRSRIFNCVENQLAQDNEATSFNFGNDWINGCLYMPLWYRKIRPKKSFFFGLFKRKAKDQWCAGEGVGPSSLKIAVFCSHKNSGNTNTAEGETAQSTTNYTGESVEYHYTTYGDGCGSKCHESKSTINLNKGLIINRETMLGQKAWYYKANEVEWVGKKKKISNEYLNAENNAMVSKTLFATDIVMLGSLNDCDTNGIPKFFNYLSGSTYNMPSDLLFSDTEVTFSSDQSGTKSTDVIQSSQKITVASGCDWGNKNEYGEEDGGLFYSIGCSYIKVDTPSCINLQRMCEIGVGLDEMQYVENIDVQITNDTDQLDYGNDNYYLRPDGFVSYDDIIDFDYRSMFATMNSNKLATKINTKTGVKEYDFRHLYIDNFDGSLKDFMSREQNGRSESVNYRYNHKLEVRNNDYLTFRMGDKPYYYDGKNLVQTEGKSDNKSFALPKYENSFYFYFGLKEGKTAIDLFNEQYNGLCATKNIITETIPYTKLENSWCSLDNDENGTYNHKTYDGYLNIDFSDLQEPFTVMFNSKNNSSVTYTLQDENGDTNIGDKYVCIYGDKLENKEKVNGYVRYYLRYENPAIVDENNKSLDVSPCYMLNNDEYVMYVTDGEGNQHAYNIKIDGEYLTFDDEVSKFAQPNNVLTKYYKQSEKGPYYHVAQSPQKPTEKITITPSEEGLPIVVREDLANCNGGHKERVEEYVKLNGTICLYNIFNNNEELNNFVVEVMPYYNDDDLDGWYEDDAKIIVQSTNNSIDIKKCNIDLNGNITKIGESEYFYGTRTNFGGGDINCIVIKSPKGGVDYKVIVTQVCVGDNGSLKMSQNYVERKIYVSEPTPYKFYINGADFDIIKNFKTGWNLKTDDNLQTSVNNGQSPFNGVGNISNIEGWLQISDVNNPYYSWSEEEKTYGASSIKFKKYVKSDNAIWTIEKDGEIEEVDYTGQYKVDAVYEIKQNVEPKQYDYEDDAAYNTAYDEWRYGNSLDRRQKSLNEIVSFIENNGLKSFESLGFEDISVAKEALDNRVEFTETMKTAFWIQNEADAKSINYSVVTDDNPYDVWSIHNEEKVSLIDEDYNESASSNDKGRRDNWIMKGESLINISEVKIPNLTAVNSKNFGIIDDSIRKGMPNTFGYVSSYKADGSPIITNGNIETATFCFGQDNIAEKSEEGGISIKPPYIVSCVNNEGKTKPENLPIGIFYNKASVNKYGIEPYKFGPVNNNRQKIKDGNNEFFQFYLIDKIFSPDIVVWSYINNIPYFVPWVNYNETPNDDNKLGYVIKTYGLLSGIIRNGITSSIDGYCEDFEEKTAFDRDMTIKTYQNDNEDSIPTRRCILYDKDIADGGKEINSEELVYQNYKHTDEVKGNVSGNTINNQYMLVSNYEGDLSMNDTSDNSATRTLYGSMRVNVSSNTVNSPTLKMKIGPFTRTATMYENGDTSLTLKVNTLNGDDDKPITYYIFEASMKEKVPTIDGNKRLWYPLNAFIPSTNENDIVYTLNSYEHKEPWKGTDDDKDGNPNNKRDGFAPQIFNKNTLESTFKDKNSDNNGDDLVQNKITSGVKYENEDGEEQEKETRGYGNTGVFKNLEHRPYFVVAVTEDGTRTISPIYDFHTVYYVIGLIESGGQKFLRTAIVYVLKHNRYENEEENDGYLDDNLKDYTLCAKPRNYYLSQFDFTVDYTITYGSAQITQNGVLYEKGDLDFISEEEFNKKYADGTIEVGAKYVTSEGEAPNIVYTVHKYTGGEVGTPKDVKIEDVDDDATEIVFEDTETSKKYYYVVNKTIDNSDGGGQENVRVYNVITINNDGAYVIDEQDYNEQPEDALEFTGSMYVTFEKKSEDGTTTETWAKVFTYSDISETTLDFDPRIPYFMRFNDKPITDDEKKSLDNLFNMSMIDIWKNIKFYVTDVTGLKHRGALVKVITDAKEWYKLQNYPSR